MRSVPFNFSGQPTQFTDPELKEETIMAETTPETKPAPEAKPEDKPETAAPAAVAEPKPTPTQQVNWWWIIIAMIAAAAAVYFFMKSKIPALPSA